MREEIINPILSVYADTDTPRWVKLHLAEYSTIGIRVPLGYFSYFASFSNPAWADLYQEFFGGIRSTHQSYASRREREQANRR